MGHDANLSMILTVRGCACCGGGHEKLCFSPGRGPTPGQTHRGVCPATEQEIWLDTQAVPGVWERLLEAAGVKE